MQRKITDYILVAFKGIAMGAADVVPGVSGGTIAFISGIYEELLTSISNINLSLIKILKKDGFSVAWNQLNGNFLLTLFSGIFISVLSLAKAIKWLLEHKPVLLWAFFFGLVLASIIYIGKQIKKWNIISVFLMIGAAFLAYYITTINPLVSENSSSLFLFLAGAIAICAMILPGVSGAFILVLLGAYKPILSAVDERDFKTILIVGLGAMVGLLSFSKILKWLFKNYETYTLATLTGFIIGSLNKIWPWKKTISTRFNSEGMEVPFKQQSVFPQDFDGNPQVLYVTLLALLGFAIIFLLERLAVQKKVNA